MKENENTLRVAAGIVSEKMSEVFNATETYDFHVELTGLAAKRVASLCTMMEIGLGTPPEDTLQYIIAVGLANIRSAEDVDAG